MVCDKLLWNKLLNRNMLTSEEKRQEKEMKEVAEQMLHMQGSQYNPVVAKMTEKQLAEFLNDLRRNMKLRQNNSNRKKVSKKLYT
jgi:signal transduction histidine kinase